MFFERVLWVAGFVCACVSCLGGIVWLCECCDVCSLFVLVVLMLLMSLLRYVVWLIVFSLLWNVVVWVKQACVVMRVSLRAMCVFVFVLGDAWLFCLFWLCWCYCLGLLRYVVWVGLFVFVWRCYACLCLLVCVYVVCCCMFDNV